MPRTRTASSILALAAAATLAASAQAQVTFNVTFEDVTANNGIGFADPNEGAARRQTITNVTNYLSTVLDGRGSANFVFRASENKPNSNTLASFGPTRGSYTGQQFFYNGLPYQRLRMGNTVFGPNDTDGAGSFNFGKNFYAGTGTVPADQFDMYSTALHEITHGLGWIDGVGPGGVPDANRTQFPVLSSWLRRGSGTNATPLWERDVNSPNYGKFVGDQSTFTNANDANTGLFFHGPFAKEIFGGAVPMFAPNPYQEGSSIAHTNVNPVALMNPSTPRGPGERTYKPFEIGMLMDLGYNQYKWDDADGTFLAGSTTETLAQSNWRSDDAFLRLNGTNYNTKASPQPGNVLAPYAKVTSNINLEFGGTGTTGYTATNDVGTTAADPFRLARMQLSSTSTAANTIAGGHFTWGQNADGTASALAPAIEQNGTGAFVISSTMSIPNGLTVRGTGNGDLTIAGAVDGAGALTKQGASKLILNGNGAANSLSFAGGLNVNAGTVDLNTAYTGAINNNGGTLNNNAANMMATVNNNAGTTNVNNNAGTVNNNGGMVNVGMNANVDMMMQNGGMTNVAGTVDNFDMFGGTVGGDGTIDDFDFWDGAFDPGNSPGDLTINNTTIYGAGDMSANGTAGGNAYYNWEIDTLPIDGGQAGDIEGWDLWEMGNLDLRDNAFEIELSSIDDLGNLAPLPNWDPNLEWSFLIATVTNNEFLTDAASFFVDDTLFASFNNVGGGDWGLSTVDGSGLYLDWTPVPEPASLALLALPALALQRRRSA